MVNGLDLKLCFSTLPVLQSTLYYPPILLSSFTYWWTCGEQLGLKYLTLDQPQIKLPSSLQLVDDRRRPFQVLLLSAKDRKLRVQFSQVQQKIGKLCMVWGVCMGAEEVFVVSWYVFISLAHFGSLSTNWALFNSHNTACLNRDFPLNKSSLKFKLPHTFFV